MPYSVQLPLGLPVPSWHR